MQKILILLIVLVIFSCGSKSNKTEKLTASRIETIKVGTPLDSVIAILGKPTSVDIRWEYNYSTICAKDFTPTDSIDVIKRINYWKNDTTCKTKEITNSKFLKFRVCLWYTRKVSWVPWTNWLWVHLGSNLTVYHVLAKRYYHFFDDEPIYSTGADETTYWSGKSTFYNTFPE